jgi:hypothetical protein
MTAPQLALLFLGRKCRFLSYLFGELAEDLTFVAWRIKLALLASVEVGS